MPITVNPFAKPKTGQQVVDTFKSKSAPVSVPKKSTPVSVPKKSTPTPTPVVGNPYAKPVTPDEVVDVFVNKTPPTPKPPEPVAPPKEPIVVNPYSKPKTPDEVVDLFADTIKTEPVAKQKESYKPPITTNPYAKPVATPQDVLDTLKGTEPQPQLSVMTPKNVLEGSVSRIRSQIKDIDPEAEYMTAEGDIITGRQVIGQIIGQDVRATGQQLMYANKPTITDKKTGYSVTLPENIAYVYAHSSPQMRKEIERGVFGYDKNVDETINKAYEKLSTEDRATYNQKYVFPTIENTEDIKNYEGGRDYLDSLPEEQKEAMIDRYLAEHPDLQKESLAVKQRDVTSALFPTSYEDVSLGAGTTYQPKSERQLRDTAWDLITTPEYELQQKYFKEAPRGAQIGLSMMKGASTAMFSPIVLGQLGVEKLTGKSIGPNIGYELARTHPASTGPSGLIGGSVSEGISFATSQPSPGEFQKMWNDPVLTASATAGEIFGGYMLTGALNPIGKYSLGKIKSGIRYSPKLLNKIPASSTLKVVTKRITGRPTMQKIYNWSLGGKKGRTFVRTSSQSVDDFIDDVPIQQRWFKKTETYYKSGRAFKNELKKWSQRDIDNFQKTKWMTPDEVKKFYQNYSMQRGVQPKPYIDNLKMTQNIWRSGGKVSGRKFTYKFQSNTLITKPTRSMVQFKNLDEWMRTGNTSLRSLSDDFVPKGTRGVSYPKGYQQLDDWIRTGKTIEKYPYIADKFKPTDIGIGLTKKTDFIIKKTPFDKLDEWMLGKAKYKLSGKGLTQVSDDIIGPQTNYFDDVFQPTQKGYGRSLQIDNAPVVNPKNLIIQKPRLHSFFRNKALIEKEGFRRTTGLWQLGNKNQIKPIQMYKSVKNTLLRSKDASATYGQLSRPKTSVIEATKSEMRKWLVSSPVSTSYKTPITLTVPIQGSSLIPAIATASASGFVSGLAQQQQQIQVPESIVSRKPVLITNVKKINKQLSNQQQLYKQVQIQKQQQEQIPKPVTTTDKITVAEEVEKPGPIVSTGFGYSKVKIKPPLGLVIPEEKEKKIKLEKMYNPMSSIYGTRTWKVKEGLEYKPFKPKKVTF